MKMQKRQVLQTTVFYIFLTIDHLPAQTSGVLPTQPLPIQAVLTGVSSAGFGISVVLSAQHQPEVLLSFTAHYT